MKRAQPDGGFSLPPLPPPSSQQRHATYGKAAKHRLLQRYYKDHYPAKATVALLTRNDSVPVSERELAFVLDNGVWVRHKIDKQDSARYVACLYKALPESVHSGRVLTRRAPMPADPLGSFAFSRKELTFDVDLDAYDVGDRPLRFCRCVDSNRVCSECWVLLESASIVFSYFVEELFGFSPPLHVFSGGRGLHCWTLDPAAARLTATQRADLVRFVDMSNDEVMRRRLAHPLPAHLLPLHGKLRCCFVASAVCKRAYFKKQAVCSYALRVVRTMLDSLVASGIEGEWWKVDGAPRNAARDSIKKWRTLEKACAQFSYGPQSKFKTNPAVFLVFRLLYPLLDEAVTASPSHLTKLPFSVHKTGRLSLPITTEFLREHGPGRMPFLRDLVVKGKQQAQAIATFNASIDTMNDWLDKSKQWTQQKLQ